MKFLNHLDLVENEARRLKMYRVPFGSYTPGVNTSGNVILDTTNNIPMWWDSTGNSGSGIWRDFSYGTTGTMNWTIQSDGGSNIQVNNGETLDLAGGQAMVTTTSGTATAPVVTFDVQNYGVMNATTTASRAGDATTNIYAVERHPTTDKLQVHVPWTQHKATTFTLTADSGTNQTIADTNTMDIAGGTGISTVVGNTDTVTVNANTWGVNSSSSAAIDTTETGNRWYGVHTDSNDKLVVRVPWTDTVTPNTTWYLRDTSNTTKSITNGKYVKFTTAIGTTPGIHSATVTGSGTTGSPWTITTSYAEMTASKHGFGKHAYDTVFTGTMATIYGGGDGFANGRTYGVIGDSNGKLCVHVPWAATTNTDANYALSVGAVSSNESTLSLVGSSGGSTTTAKFSGTTNEIQITTPSTGNGGDITIGLPDDVTITNDLTVGNDVVITGDLTVNGSTTTVNTTQLEVEDNIIRINKVDSAASSANTSNAGIEVERGSLSNVGITWAEGSDTWYVSEASNQANGGSLVSKKIIQNVFTTVTGNSGTASVNSSTTALAITGTGGITTTGSGQALSISGSGITSAFSKVATISSTSINASTNKKATISHGLSTKDVIVRLYEVNGEGQYDEIYADVAATTTAAITVQFSANLSNNVRVVIMAADNAGSVTPSYS